MKYYYRFGDNKHDELYEDPNREFYTDAEINAIPLYPATPELDKEWEEDETSDLWCIYDICGFSWEPVECKDEKDARNYLGQMLNRSIFEYIHDI